MAASLFTLGGMSGGFGRGLTTCQRQGPRARQSSAASRGAAISASPLCRSREARAAAKGGKDAGASLSLISISVENIPPSPHPHPMGAVLRLEQRREPRLPSLRLALPARAGGGALLTRGGPRRTPRARDGSEAAARGCGWRHGSRLVGAGLLAADSVRADRREGAQARGAHRGALRSPLRSEQLLLVLDPDAHLLGILGRDALGRLRRVAALAQSGGRGP